MGKSRRRYVLRGVPGGWRIWDNVLRGFWGDFYETCPDELVAELNGQRRHDVIVDLTREARRARR